MQLVKMFLVLLGVVGLSECQRPASIQCFQCNTATAGEEDCADPFDAPMQDKYRRACTSGSTTCLKVVQGQTVVRQCNIPANATCGAAEVESPTGTFTYCCTGNACNSAGRAGRSVALAGSMLLACTMFGL